MGEPEIETVGDDDLKAYVEAGNAGMSPMTERLASEHPARMVTHRLSSADLYEIEPSTYAASHADLAILYVHGGGFTVGFGLSAAYAAHPIAGMMGVRTFSIDYGMPPDRPFPAGLDDTVEAYRFLLKRYSAEKIAVYGPSAGGGLAAAFLLKARDLGLPFPAACVLASPEADLTESGDTFETNDMIDVVLKHRLTNSIRLYANGHDLTQVILSQIVLSQEKHGPARLVDAGGEVIHERGQALLDYVRKTLNVPADLRNQMERRREDLEERADETIERALRRLRIPSRTDIDRINQRLDRITTQLKQLGGTQPVTKRSRKGKAAR